MSYLTARNVRIGLTIYIAFVFIQSLFFKFMDAPETQHIFNTLDMWAANEFGISGLFAKGGVLSGYVIGTAELIASIILIAGASLNRTLFSIVGAAMAMGIMSGAIFFHLFTPLGIDVQNDGGLLFAMACLVWLSAAVILYTLRRDIVELAQRLI